MLKAANLFEVCRYCGFRGAEESVTGIGSAGEFARGGWARGNWIEVSYWAYIYIYIIIYIYTIYIIITFSLLGIYIYTFLIGYIYNIIRGAFPKGWTRLSRSGKTLSLLDPPFIWIHLPPNHKSLGTLGRNYKMTKPLKIIESSRFRFE